MMIYIIVLLWAGCGHLAYILFAQDHHATLEEAYDTNTFIFVTLFGPLIFLFINDKS